MKSILHKSYGAARSIHRRHLVDTLLTILILCSLNTSTLAANAAPTSSTATTSLPGSWQVNSTTCPSICTNPPHDNCAFYADCLESKYNCGPDGYPIGFGQQFCEKFGVNRAELSTKGQTWMLDTMQCLQRDLVPEATSTAGVTCASLRKKAFASHGPCYVQSGLCTLPPSDWLAIVGIVELKTLFDSKDSFLATLSAGEGCLEAFLFFLENLIYPDREQKSFLSPLFMS